MNLGVQVKYQICLSNYNQIWSFITDFRKSPLYEISRKSVQYEPRY